MHPDLGTSAQPMDQSKIAGVTPRYNHHNLLSLCEHELKHVPGLLCPLLAAPCWLSI